MIRYNGERVIPIGYINNDYRAYTVSEYAATGTVGMYYYTGGTYDSYVTNGTTRVYHQPSFYGEGYTNEGGTSRKAKIATLMSVHYSPLSPPTLGVGPGGAVAGASNCRYTDGYFDPQRYDAEHAIHNVVLTGQGVALKTTWGFDTNLVNSQYHRKNVYIRAGAWFLLRVSPTGNMGVNFGNIKYIVNAWTYDAADDDETCQQTATVVQPAVIGEWKYYMVKTSGGHARLVQSNPHDTTNASLIWQPTTIYQPTVKINFTGTSGSCTVQAMSWGYDCWADGWAG